MRVTLALIALGLVTAVFVYLLVTGNLTKLPAFAAFEGPAMIGFILVLFIPGAFGHPWLADTIILATCFVTWWCLVYAFLVVLCWMGTYGMDDPGGR